MVETSLTRELMEAGASLVRKLDERGLAPDAAFWLYSSELQAWKLVLVELKVGHVGPRKVYEEIQKTLAEVPDKNDLTLDDIALHKPDSTIVELIRKAMPTGPGVFGIRFKNNVVDGTLIEDAYIYRVN
jgi:hypothetical protein